MSKWIRIEKSQWGLSASLLLFNKLNFYAGRTDHWGISADINFYDRAITFGILNLYVGVELWHKEYDAWTEIDISKSDWVYENTK